MITTSQKEYSLINSKHPKFKWKIAKTFNSFYKILGYESTFK